MANPVLVEAVRGDRTESLHRGAYAVCDADGRLVAAAGDVDRPIYPRSAYKILQAVPLVESGAAAAFGLATAELALACASHSGEPRHVETVLAWLGRIGLDETALECGAHPPRHQPSAEALIRSGREPGPAFNNCSGKHTGFLTVARHLGLDPAGYVRPHHKVQTLACDTICGFAGVDRARVEIAIDGCSAPALTLPLKALARAMARCADPAGLTNSQAAAATTLIGAIAAEPFLVAGSGRCCTALIEESGGRALVKVGAEGVYAGILPERGFGIALKIEDGGTRAAELAMSALLVRFGVLDPENNRVRAFHRPDLTNWRSIRTGYLKEADNAFDFDI